MTKIQLNRGFVAIVDDEDFVRLSKFNWHVDTTRNGYARAARNVKIEGTPGKKRLRYLHQEVLNNPKGVVVDHVNGDGLDCQKTNLRSSTVQQNIMNSRTTKGRIHKGVHFSEDRQKWVAQLMFSRKQIYLGRFETKMEALLAYDEAARKYFGEFAALNFPKEGEQAAYRG